MIDAGTMIDNRWELRERIGRGGFGIIFSAFDTQENTQVAVKISKTKQYLRDSSALSLEYGIYKILLANEIPPGIPRPIAFLTEEARHVMVLPLLGKSLKAVFRESGALSMRQVCDIGCQLLTTLEFVHGLGILHLDIKPCNIVFGSREECEKVYLIDFGTSRHYVDENGAQLVRCAGRRFAGTAAFSSMHTDEGCERAPRDDVESLFYTLVMLHRGSLPWTDEKWRLDDKGAKRRYREVVCGDLRGGVRDGWEIVKEMGHYDQVDYEGLRKLLCKE